MPEYTIYGGDAGYKRLEVLAEAIGQSSASFLDKHDIHPGMHCLDLGCGGGAVTMMLAEKVGAAGSVLGIDLDPRNIEQATQLAKRQWLTNVAFEERDAYTLNAERQYDLVYMRFLLSHLHDPVRVLRSVHRALQPGGIILIEDTDFTGHFTYPPSEDFDAYVGLYQALLKTRGANANIGQQLPFLLEEAGFAQIEYDISHPAYITGPGKLMAEITFEGISRPLISEGLITEAEYEVIHAGIRRHRERKETLMSLPRIFQVVGRKQ